MSAGRQVVVVGGGPGLCDRLRLLGAEITLVDTPDRHDPELVSIARRSILTGFDDPALIPMLVALHRETPFVAVLSLTELGLLPAARIAEALELPGLPPVVVGRTRDKLAMRTWLRGKGFSDVPSALVTDAADIRAFAAEHGYPVVVKPRHGQASEHVSCFRDAAAVTDPPAIGDDHVVEPFLAGPEFSVEAFSHGGLHRIVAITGKSTQDADPEHPFVEIGHVVPAPVDPGDGAAIRAYVAGLLDTLGISDGCSHTELRLTSAGPEVLETHTRVGGDSIPTLVRQATGWDLIDMLVRWTVGGIAPEAPEPGVPGAAAIRFFTPRPGIVTAVRGVARWRGRPGVLALHLPVRPGDRIVPVRDSGTRAGHVVATGPTAHAALALCGEAVSGVEIDIG